MKILHTSDWHVGRTFHGYDLHAFHQDFFEWLVDLVQRENFDAVVVSGDIYDRSVPSAESVTMLDEALRKLCSVTTVVLTSGNHDSSRRLGFGASLMNERLRILTDLKRFAEPVVLADEHGEIFVYGLPYLEPDIVRPLLRDDGFETVEYGRSHEAVLSGAMRRVRADMAHRAPNGVRTLLMAHAFVMGGEESESERDIKVGGVDAVPAGVFSGVDYVALGHLHGPQRIVSPEQEIHYSGSPLAFSFSEKSQRKSVIAVTYDASGVVSVEHIPVPQTRQLIELKGRLDDILNDANPAHASDWVKVTITDPVRPPDANRKLQRIFPHLVQTIFDPEGVTLSKTARIILAQESPVDVACSFVEYVTGVPASENEHELIAAVHETVRIGGEK